MNARMSFAWLLAIVVFLAGCESEADAALRRESLLNQQRIEMLKRGNDSLTQPREVVFWARFRQTTDVPCFEGWLSQHGFTVQYTSERKKDDFPHVVEFTRSLVPTLETMNSTTAQVMQAASACKGVFQEWEAPVVP
jgi:hypothetical protein